MDDFHKKSEVGAWLAGIGCGIPLIIIMFYSATTDGSNKPARRPLSDAQRIGIDEITIDLKSKHAVDRHEMGASGMVRLYVGPSWSYVPLDVKQSYCSSLMRYYSDNNAVAVRVIDRNGKGIALYNYLNGYTQE